MPNYPKPLDEGQQQVAEMVAAQAQAMGVPVDLALAMAYQESRFRHADENGRITKSPKGAIGLMQVTPDTARQYKFDLSDLRDPQKNLNAGLTILKDLLGKSNGVGEIAAAKYNGGPNRKFFETGEGSLPDETVDYVEQITKMGGFGGQPSGERGPAPDKQFVDVPPAPKPGEAAPAVASDGTEVEPTPGLGVPRAQIYAQDTSNPQEDFETNKQLAAGTGGALGAAYGFAESRSQAAETKAMRDAIARQRVERQFAQMEAQQLAETEARGPGIRLQPGALSEPTATGGTSGEKWSRNWRGVETPGSRSVPESASMYQRGKVQGGSKASQRINRLYPKLSPDDPNSIYERLSKQSNERAAAQQLAEEQANNQRLAQIQQDTERARAARIESERPINRARAALTSLSETPVGEISGRVARTMLQRFPVVGYGAASASMGKNVAEIDEAMRQKEYIDAILAASQLAATGASMVPAFAPVAFPAAVGLEAVKQARDYYR